MKIHNLSNLPTIDYRTVKPLQGNLKDLDQKNHDRLLRVLNKRGFTTPIFIWKNPEDSELYLLDGHQRQRVMQKNDLNDNGNYLVPYALIPGATEQEAKEQLLEITSQYGHLTMEGLDEFAFDIDLTELDVHFDALDLDKFLDGLHDTDEVEEDEAPPVDDVSPAVSQLGEVYQLGRHRLMCGDSTDFGTVSELMNGVQADMVFTDPPYNQSHSGGGFNETRKGWKEHKEGTLNDFEPEEMFSILGTLEIKSGYFFCNKGLLQKYLTWAETFNGWDLLVMGKNNPIPTKSNKFLSDIEYIVFVRQQGAYFDDSLNYDFYRKVRMVSVKSREFDHPTEKQVGFIAPLLQVSSPKEGSVLDLFGGSGTTLMACEQTGRTCYMMELDPKYCDVIRKRYANHIGAEDWQVATPVIQAVEV